MDNKLYQLLDWPKMESIIYSEEDKPQDLLGAQVTKKVVDAHSFPPQITKKDTDKFNSGIHYTIYDCLGAHPRTLKGVKGVSFAVWAPNAMRVSVVGDFNEWDGRVHQMQRLWDSGIFELFVPGAKIGDRYKFELKVKGGHTYLKSDPYGFSAQLRPGNASVIHSIENYQWNDQEWLLKREHVNSSKQPLNVYEIHLGSFAKPKDGRDFYNYRELAQKIIQYVTEMGYTHIELLPIMEHPLDASWGYQTIGYYAPTARYGTPDDFMYFMDEMHKAQIGVILDWVPAYFPRDIHGLSAFDGTFLYEQLDPKKGEHPHCGTLIYNYGRPEVSNYLIANAMFWIERYHADGIRMSAVASMLYLDYGRQDGKWAANIYGGNENLEAIEFIKHLNSMIRKRGKGALSIAEGATAWPKMTEALQKDGLGFDYKWNMGWKNDYLSYIKFDPYFRSYHHSDLTFSMIYAYCENFFLALSHDEVVHGKASLMGKMPGTIKEKFSNMRLTYAYMIMHPGKKLLFMGQDIGEFEEWNEQRSIQWNLLDHESHKKWNQFVKDSNTFYKKYPALFELDAVNDGFEWINSISSKECILVFLRKTKNMEDTLLIICNFSNIFYKDHKIGVPFSGKYKEILNSDSILYGGEGNRNPRVKRSNEDECDARPNSIKITIAPLSVSVFSYRPTEISKDAIRTTKSNKKVKEK